MGSIDAVDNIILFDGVCNLCNGAVQFIIKRDPAGRFKFAALQSEAGARILSQTDSSFLNLTSIVLMQHGSLLTKSDAALAIARGLNSGWPAFYVFKFIPVSVRNWIYDWIATNRYRWFGKRDSCMIPTPELKQRFL